MESVKAASDLYAPVAGTIAAVNDKLTSNPELVNSDPYGEGWILKVEVSGEVPSDLMDEDESGHVWISLREARATQT